MRDEPRHGPQPIDSGAEDRQVDTTEDPWAAFEPLYDEHHDHLYRVAVLLCSGNTADAEDAVAETFIRVHRAWSEGRIHDFYPYARRSLVNYVMGHYRQQRTADRYRTVTSIDPNAGTPIDQRVVDSTLVTDALDRLTLRQRTAVVLRFFEDLPYRDIAAEMGVAVGTAKAQVSIGLSQLRRLIAGGGDE